MTDPLALWDAGLYQDALAAARASADPDAALATMGARPVPVFTPPPRPRTFAAAFDESQHPRDDHGRFVSKADLDAAKSDPAKAAELRGRVTDPTERTKLEAHLDPGSPAAVFARHPEVTNTGDPVDHNYWNLKDWSERHGARLGADPAAIRRAAAGHADRLLAGYKAKGRAAVPHVTVLQEAAERARREVGAATYATRSKKWAADPDEPAGAFARHPDMPPVADTHADPAFVRAEYERKAAEDGVDPAAVRRRAAAHLDAALAGMRAAGRREADHDSLLHVAYNVAHDAEMVAAAVAAAVAQVKANTAAFADSYYEHDNPVRRAAGYLKQLRAGDIHPDDMDADYRQAVAEDLAKIPAAKLAAHVLEAADDHGTDGGVWGVAKLSADVASHARRGATPERFDGEKPQDWHVMPLADLNEDQAAGAAAAAKALGPGAVMVGPDAVAFHCDSPLWGALDDKFQTTGHTLDTDEGMGRLFDALKTPPLVAEADVPASAKNYGRTSGHLDPGAVGGDWDPNAPDVYRQVSPNWYVVRTGTANPDSDTYTRHSLVHRRDVPPTARLPDPYWTGLHTFDEAPEGAVPEQAERTEVRREKATAEGARQKRELDRHANQRDETKYAAALKGMHRKTGDLVRSDDALHTRIAAASGDHGFSADDVPSGNAVAGRLLDTFGDRVSDLDSLDGPGHDDYDPEGFDGDIDDARTHRADGVHWATYEGGKVKGGEGGRDEHVGAVRAALDTLGDIEDQIHEHREDAKTRSAEFRQDAAAKLWAAHDTARQVLALPPADLDPAARVHAQDAYRKIRKCLAKVKLPRPAPAGPPEADADADAVAEARQKAADRRGVGAAPGAREVTREAVRVAGEHRRTGNVVAADEALHEAAVNGLGGRYSFDPDEHLADPGEHPHHDAAAAELNDALADLSWHDDPAHEYDPDAVDPGDVDPRWLALQPDSLVDAAGNRQAHREEADDVAGKLAKWKADAAKTTARARQAATRTSAAYRESLAPKLERVRAAAGAVLAIPRDHFADAAPDGKHPLDHAADIHARAERLLARTRKPVSFAATAD